jgi:putative peptidoglycan lipid II flippase
VLLGRPSTISRTAAFAARLRSLPSGELSGGRPSPNGAVSWLLIVNGTTPIPITAAGRGTVAGAAEQAKGTSVSRAGRVMALGTMASRATGLVRSTLLVSALGSLALGDAFQIGNSLPNMVSTLPG